MERKVHATNEHVVTLVMDGHDAAVLYAILARVGGNPAGPRGTAERILDALERVDIQSARDKMDVRTTPSSLFVEWNQPAKRE